jgi:hypothetical protein
LKKKKSILLLFGLLIVGAGVFVATKIKPVVLPKTQRELELIEINKKLNTPTQAEVFLKKAETIWTNPNKRPSTPEELAKLDEMRKKMRLL